MWTPYNAFSVAGYLCKIIGSFFLMLTGLHESFDLAKFAYLWYVTSTDCSDRGILKTLQLRVYPGIFSRSLGERLHRDNYLLVIMGSLLH